MNQSPHRQPATTTTEPTAPTLKWLRRSPTDKPVRVQPRVQGISRNVQQLLEAASTPTVSRVVSHGLLEAALTHSRSDTNRTGSRCKPTTDRLERQLHLMRSHPEVIVLDFGWRNYVTYATSDHWGNIPNLNPARLRFQRDQQLQAAHRKLTASQAAKTEAGSAYRNRRDVLALESALVDDAGLRYQAGVRTAMLETLRDLTAPYRVIVTENLDVASLYARPEKRAVIDDLGWRSLLETITDMARDRGQSLLLLPRAYQSLRCPLCGCSSRRNRVRNAFACVACGMDADPDLVAVLNLWRGWLGCEL